MPKNFFDESQSKKETFKAVNATLKEMLDKNFEEMHKEMINDLNSMGVPKEEHNEYIQHLYLKVQVALIKEYKKDLKAKVEEIKKQPEHQKFKI